MTDRVDLTGIEVQARHGVFPEERSHPQLFRVDVSMHLDLSGAAASDALSDTVDYGSVAQRIHDLVAGESHQLIETIASRVAELVLADASVDRVVVTVHKPEAPLSMPFQDVSVTIDRSK